ncbi:hypothetical protein L0222_13760 [bacterium]|nr:hypothetical protein [bacterium]MCI0603825.1 hypothetical protein [bacterium]
MKQLLSKVVRASRLQARADETSALHRLKYLCLSVSICGFFSTALADSTPVLNRTGKTFDPAIPTIRSVLGYDFGEQITRHSAMEQYMNALAKSSPKIKVQKIGETYEGRALYYLIISSPENMSRLEELRQANLKLADPRKSSAGEANEIIQKNPVFVCLSYSVHGAEHSGAETALALAYYLVAGTDAETQEILRNCVILIDPMENPDGRERFISYFYSTVGVTPNSDPNAAEHNQTWPGGRYNHYLFDMNRDWTVLSQKETLARIKAYQQYHPQIFIDVHEMSEDSSYFFPPPTVPHNPHIPPNMVEWWNKLGKAVSGEFDRHRVEYFTQERFDFWYPGYGDSWPTYNGALSGTFEQASVRGLIRKRYDEKVVHYHDAIWHHFLSTLATCKLAATNREARLRDFYRFRESAIEEGKIGPIRQYLIRRSTDPNQADRLVEKLIWQGVEVRQLQNDFKVEAYGYYSEGMSTHSFRKGDYVISLEQPLKRLLRSLFDKETLPDKKFLEEEEQRRKDKEPSEFYDISAWSLPLAYNLDAYWSTEPAPAGAELIQTVPQENPAIPDATYAYLLNYDSNEVIQAAQELLQRNVRVYFTTKPFTLQQRKYNAGSLIIKISDQPSGLASQLQQVSKTTGLRFEGTNTAWTEEGPDLGSNDVYFVERPKVAVLTQMPTDPTSYGAILYLFEQRYQFPFTALPTTMLNDVKLKDYNVVILPDEGGISSYQAIVGDEGIKTLKNWVQEGGTVIAVGSAAAFIAENGELTSVKRIQKFKKDSKEPVEEKKAEGEQEKEPEEETEKPDVIPGAIGRAKLNLKHFLTFGYRSEEIPVFLYSSNVLEAPAGVKPVASYPAADRLKMSGLIWDISRQRLENKVYLMEESLGSGHVILFAEDPTFRAYWEGLDKLFFNGVLFGPSM